MQLRRNAKLVVICLLLIGTLSFSFFLESYAAQSSSSTNSQVQSPQVSQASSQNTGVSGVSTTSSQWQLTGGVSFHEPNVTFGAPQSEMGTLNDTFAVQAGALISESFVIRQATRADSISFLFVVPQIGSPNVTVAVYLNGQLSVQSTQSVSASVPQYLLKGKSAPSVAYVGVPLNVVPSGNAVTLQAGTVVTMAVLPSSLLYVYSVPGARVLPSATFASSTITYNNSEVPSTLLGTGPSAPMFCAWGQVG